MPLAFPRRFRSWDQNQTPDREPHTLVLCTRLTLCVEDDDSYTSILLTHASRAHKAITWRCQKHERGTMALKEMGGERRHMAAIDG